MIATGANAIAENRRGSFMSDLTSVTWDGCKICGRSITEEVESGAINARRRDDA
jgi:hypothetical protein